MAKRTEKQIKGIFGKIPQSFKDANPGITEGRLVSRWERQNKGSSSGSSGSKGLFNSLPAETKNPIQTQYNTNLATAAAEAGLNRVNEVNPFGSRNYSIDPATGQPVATTSMNPFEGTKYMNETYLELERNKLAGEGGILNQMRSAISKPLDYSGLTQIPGQGDMLSFQREQADALYQDYLRQNDPIFQQQTREFEQQMADRGIPQGSEQYNRLYQELNKAQNNARLSAQTQARTTGADIGALAFNQAGQARSQGIAELGSLRNQPFLDTQNLLGLNRGYQMPNYSPMANVNVAPTDVTGTSLGYSQMKSNENLAKLNNANSLAVAGIQADASKFGANAGIREAEIRNQGANQLQQNEFANQPSPWQGAIGAIAQGAGAGIGQGIFGNLFKR